jgi:hypothetical protein
MGAAAAGRRLPFRRMSEIFEYDVNGDGNLDVVEVTTDSDGGTLVVADTDGDGYGDLSAYDADGDGVADPMPASAADEAPSYDEAAAPAESAEPAESSEPSAAAPTYSQWAANQNYQEAYRNSVYGDPNKW